MGVSKHVPVAQVADNQLRERTRQRWERERRQLCAAWHMQTQQLIATHRNISCGSCLLSRSVGRKTQEAQSSLQWDQEQHTQMNWDKRLKQWSKQIKIVYKSIFKKGNYFRFEIKLLNTFVCTNGNINMCVVFRDWFSYIISLIKVIYDLF